LTVSARQDLAPLRIVLRTTLKYYTTRLQISRASLTQFLLPLVIVRRNRLGTHARA